MKLLLASIPATTDQETATTGKSTNADKSTDVIYEALSRTTASTFAVTAQNEFAKTRNFEVQSLQDGFGPPEERLNQISPLESSWAKNHESTCLINTPRTTFEDDSIACNLSQHELTYANFNELSSIEMSDETFKCANQSLSKRAKYSKKPNDEICSTATLTSNNEHTD